MVAELLILGAIILIGVVGNFISARTHIPESLFLIATGLVIGPVLHLVPSAFFNENLGLFVSFALVIVLINSGMNLDMRHALRTMRGALLFVSLVFVCTVAVVTAVLHGLFDWPILHGLFLGIIVSGTTTVTVTHLVEHLDPHHKLLRRETKDLLVLESVLNDVSVIAGASVLVAIIAPGVVNAQGVLTTLFNEFLVSILVGAGMGVCWLFLYAYRLHANKLSYIFTVGVALTIYAIAEFLNLNGAIAVILFAITVGNYKMILKFLHAHTHLENLRKAVDAMRQTDVEFTFLIRTFFFVVLGLIFDPTILSMRGLLLIAGAILVCKFVARYVASRLLAVMSRKYAGDHFVRTTVVANGFTSTLAAFVGVQAGIAIPYLAEIVLLLVISTTITAILSTATHHQLVKRSIARKEIIHRRAVDGARPARGLVRRVRR